MVATAVIGANFGDEGKGLITDYLCTKEGAGVVIRFNGGAQAGHTVVLPDGRRHVHHHFGSGTLAGVRTYLSKYFICNPILFMEEHYELGKLGVRPRIEAHPKCMVTTFVDMVVNQGIEDGRRVGGAAHGSCGVGIFQTICRNKVFPLYMKDLWEGPKIVRPKVAAIVRNYLGGNKDEIEEAVEEFCKVCHLMANLVEPGRIHSFSPEWNPVFEGAQGLLLDQNNKEYFPHLTPSNTGIQNVLALCHQTGISKLDVYYVSRTYLTRHGAGPLPGEKPNMSFPDDTNVDHPYQGKLRFAPLDRDALMDRTATDWFKAPPEFKLRPHVVYTHCDQLGPPHPWTIMTAWGPTRNDIQEK